MIQAEKIIEIGKYSFDVSNISVKRKRIASKMWNVLFNIKINKDGEPEVNEKGEVQLIETPKKRTEKQATRGLLIIGLYLVRQDFKILDRRFKYTDAIKEFFKRYFVTVRYIESLTPDQMNNFVEWIYEVVTGSKKKVTDLMSQIMSSMGDLVKDMSEEEILHLTIFLENSFSEQVKQFQNLRAGQKKAL